MAHWWTARWRRGPKNPRQLRARLRVECLEDRTLLTQGLVVVPSPVVTAGNLFGAAAIAHNDIWSVGDFETLNANDQIQFDPLAEHFDGTSWSVVSTPSLPNGGIFKGVAAVAGDDVWAVGFRFASNGIVIGSSVIEHWNGNRWSEVASGKLQGAQFTGVTAVSANDVWAVGADAGNNALVMHWNGSTWSQVSSPAFTNVGSLSAVSADASNDVWAVGCCGPLGTGQALLHWDGTSWTLASSHPRFGPVAVTALSATNVWVAGTVEDSDNDSPIAAVEHWDGTSWSIVPSPNPNPGKDQNSHLLGIAAISASDIWAVGDIGAPFGHIATLTEHWDGTSWSVIASPNPGSTGNRLYGVTALSDGTVAAMGHQSGTTSDSGLVLQNAGSAPKSGAAPLAAPATRAATTPAARSWTSPARVDAALLDQLFVAAGGGDQALPSAHHTWWPHEAAAKGALDGLHVDIWSWDRR
jgi:hypothetical protein